MDKLALIIKLVFETLGPVAVAMVGEWLKGGSILSPLTTERLKDIIPAESQAKIALEELRLRAGIPK
jgi:hypothetical protein